MGYRKAEQVLPVEIIEIIQDYIDGECIYIPRKKNNRRVWGEGTRIREELTERNFNIFADYQRGIKSPDIAKKYFLSEKSVQRIIGKMKNGL